MKQARRPSICRAIGSTRMMLKAAQSAARAGNCAGASLFAAWVLEDLARFNQRASREKSTRHRCAASALRAAEEVADLLSASINQCRRP